MSDFIIVDSGVPIPNLTFIDAESASKYIKDNFLDGGLVVWERLSFEEYQISIGVDNGKLWRERIFNKKSH